MSAPTFCLGIPHTPWVPARVESLTKLLIALGESEADGVLRARRVFGERALNHVWSEEMWRWGVSREGRSGGVDPTHFLTLQDDVKVAPNFWPALRAMVEAVPDEVIALEVVHPAAPLLAAKGHRWFTSPDCIVGVGYVLPMAAL